jgi:hypothetical protein
MENTGAADRSRITQEAVTQNQAAMRAMAAVDLAGAEAALVQAVSLARDCVPRGPISQPSVASAGTSTGHSLRSSRS